MEITTPNPVGRPTDYKEEYCETVLKLGAKGKSKTQMAVACGVSNINALDRWAEKHPDFCIALERAMMISQDWWEDQLQSGLFDMDGRKLNGTACKQMAARFPKTWREQSNVTLDATIQKKVKAKFSERTDD